MKRFICALCAFVLCLPLCGCGGEKMAEHLFFAMDTVITLRLSPDADKARMAEIFAEVESITAEIAESLSRTHTRGDTHRFNEGTDGITEVSDTFRAVLLRASEIAADTDGTFSPAMGTLTDLWNVNGGGPVPAEEAIAEALSHTDLRTVIPKENGASKTDSALRLDFGAIGKGYAAQKVLEYLRTTEIRYGLVSFGGNVGVFGEKPDGTPFKIGLTDPRNTSRTAGYLLAETGFVSVSGDYERYFEEGGVRYHHILDPQTGYPAQSGLASVAVFSTDGALADALSTALFVMGEEKALAYYEAHAGEFEAVLITNEQKIILTSGLTREGRFIPEE